MYKLTKVDLILTRRVGETIMIGDDIAVTVLAVTGSQVRIGVNAPKETSVHREEIYARIQNEKEQLALDAHNDKGKSAAAEGVHFPTYGA